MIPRSANQWAFGNSGPFFAGNPKYLFLWMSLNCPDIKVTWLSSSKKTIHYLQAQGYRAYRRWSLHGIWSALRAKVFVSSNSFYDVNFVLSSNAFRLNLWHGVGLKSLDRHPQAVVDMVENDKVIAKILSRIRGQLRTPRPDLFITTSDFTQAHFSRVFGLPPERCPQLGYPRLDCAVDRELANVAIELDRIAGFQLKPDEFTEIYLYAPTHRDSVRSFFSEAIPDVEHLSEILGERNAFLYIKPHPGTSEFIPNTYNICQWPGDIDIHPYLESLTGLITDYSSVLYDYLYLGSGASILYTFDMDQYRSLDRSLQYDYESNTGGLRVMTFDMLCDALRYGYAAKSPSRSETDTIVQRFWGGSSIPASPAIVGHVRRLLTK